MSTHLSFRYSDIYDSTLAVMAGQSPTEIKVQDSYNFVDSYAEYWKKYNDNFFSYYAQYDLVLPDSWIAYFINPKKGLTPFSDPLTLVIKNNFEHITATLVHELCHVFLIQSYYDNTGVAHKLIGHVLKKYENEDINTQWHIIVNILAKYGLVEIFGQDKTNELLSEEKNYSGLARAWKIIDANPQIMTSQDPIKAILAV